MNDLGLTLFHDLCLVGNALVAYRERFVPCSDDWTAVTCLILALDGAIDRLVGSSGLEGDDDA